MGPYLSRDYPFGLRLDRVVRQALYGQTLTGAEMRDATPGMGTRPLSAFEQTSSPDIKQTIRNAPRAVHTAPHLIQRPASD